MNQSSAFGVRRRWRGVVVVVAVWAVAVAACSVFVGRMEQLPAKGPGHPHDADGGPLMAVATTTLMDPRVPPDPGHGPLPLCWVDPSYTPAPGEFCPAVQAGPLQP